MPSRMYLSPTGVRTTVPPAASTACCSPPFESTETTSVPMAGSAASAPGRARRSSARTPEDLVAVDDLPRCRPRPRAGPRRRRGRSPRSAPVVATRAASPCGSVAPQWRLMFSPSGRSLMTSTLAPGGAEDPGRDRARRAVRAVDDDPTARTRRSSAARRLAMGDVPVDPVASVDDDAEALRRGAGELVGAPDQLLELVLDRVVELQPVRRRGP